MYNKYYNLKPGTLVFALDGRVCFTILKKKFNQVYDVYILSSFSPFAIEGRILEEAIIETDLIYENGILQ